MDKIQSQRLASMDLLRGLAMLFVIIFHSSIYNFANIHKIDFSDPPLLIIVVSFTALWGGIFVLYSGIMNAYMLKKRNKSGFSPKYFYALILGGVIYMLAHYLLVYVLGRWTLDFENNLPDLTLAVASIRDMSIQLPPMSKLVEGTSLMSIGSNLVITSLLLLLLFRNGGAKKVKRNYVIISVIAVVIMLSSFIRVPLYPIYENALTGGNYLLAGVTSFFLANPYPLIPYLAYGLFGALIGMLYFDGRRDLLKKVVIPLGLLFLVYGVVGAGMFDKSISQADGFWYFKTNIELGLFMLLSATVLLFIEGKGFIRGRFTLLKWFSRVSLTIYLFETLLSDFTRHIYVVLSPNWDQTLNGSLGFGLFNVFIWAIILLLWSRVDFKYSLEYFWIKLFDHFGKDSTKLEL